MGSDGNVENARMHKEAMTLKFLITISRLGWLNATLVYQHEMQHLV